jgi:hypothetical protein
LVPLGPLVSEKKIKKQTPFLTPLDLWFLLCTSDQQKKAIHFLEDHQMNIPTKFGSNLPSGFREEDQKQITTRVVGHNFERNSPKDHPCKIWFNLVQWFLRRRFKCEIV